MGEIKKKVMIRNSSAEFLIFTTQSGKENIDVRIEDENIWLTQKLIGKLFAVEVNTINYHLKEIFKSNELTENAVIRKFRITASDGKNYEINHYNLEAIIAIGFRVNSDEAVNFRRWANRVLKDFTLKGYVLDDVRLKNGSYLSKEYFRDLILQIRDIRESEQHRRCHALRRNSYLAIANFHVTDRHNGECRAYQRIRGYQRIKYLAIYK